MEYCAQGDGRANTISWMLKMIDEAPRVCHDIHVALVAGLGSLLQTRKGPLGETIYIELNEIDERLVIQAMEVSVTGRLAVADAIADLQLYSCGLADWVLSGLQSNLLTEGRWPIRHVATMSKMAVINNSSIPDQHWLLRLAESLVGRLHSCAFNPLEREEIMEACFRVRGRVSVSRQQAWYSPMPY